MPGCQVIKANESYCRNYSMKGKTCCYQHRHLEHTVEESDSEYQESEKQISEEISVITSEEEISDIENYDSDDSVDSVDSLWGPEEIDEHGCVTQTMNSVFPWKSKF